MTTLINYVCAYSMVGNIFVKYIITLLVSEHIITKSVFIKKVILNDLLLHLFLSWLLEFIIDYVSFKISTCN